MLDDLLVSLHTPYRDSQVENLLSTIFFFYIFPFYTREKKTIIFNMVCVVVLFFTLKISPGFISNCFCGSNESALGLIDSALGFI